MVRHTRRFRFPALLPKGNKERHRIELFGGATVVLLALLILAAFYATSLQQKALQFPNVAAVVAALLVDLTNQDRALYGLGELSMDPTLVAVAQAKANDMAEKSYFAHTSPEGLDPWHWFDRQGYDYRHAGENLAVNFSDSGDVERAWMASPTHRENILDGRYTEIGIATAQGTYQGRSTTFVVQVFGLPAQAGTPAEPALAAAEPSGASALESVAEPAVLAAAPTEEEIQVLGSAAGDAGLTAEEKASAAPVATTSPALAASISQEVSRDIIPSWGYVVGFPKGTLRLAYLLLGFLILLALIVETGLELKWHHRHKALRAGFLLATMTVLFVAADYFFFIEPVLALANTAG